MSPRRGVRRRIPLVRRALALVLALVLAGGLVVASTAGCGLRERADAVPGGTTRDGDSRVGARPAEVSPSDVDAVEAALDAAEGLASELERQLATDGSVPS